MENNRPLVAIVILNYNTRGLLERFIPYVLRTNYPNFKVVVADNDSHDGSADLVKDKFPDVEVLQIDGNLGYAGGYNYALDRIEADLFVLLNSDVEVTENWLTPMVDLLTSDEKISAVQPKICQYKDHKSFEYAGAAGGFIDKWGFPFCRGRIFDTMEPDEGQYNDNSEVFWASGAALLIRAKDFRKEKLDEDFFAHMEEIDLCWRLRNRGHQIWACGQSVVYHIGGGTLSQQNSRKTFLNYRNNLAMLTKNLPAGRLWKVLISRLLFWDLIAGVKFLLSGEVKNFIALIKAHWSFFGQYRKWHRKRAGMFQVSQKGTTGYYNKSVVLQFFILQRKKFSKLR